MSSSTPLPAASPSSSPSTQFSLQLDPEPQVTNDDLHPSVHLSPASLQLVNSLHTPTSTHDNCDYLSLSDFTTPLPEAVTTHCHPTMTSWQADSTSPYQTSPLPALPSFYGPDTMPGILLAIPKSILQGPVAPPLVTPPIPSPSTPSSNHQCVLPHFPPRCTLPHFAPICHRPHAPVAFGSRSRSTQTPRDPFGLQNPRVFTVTFLANHEDEWGLLQSTPHTSTSYVLPSTTRSSHHARPSSAPPRIERPIHLRKGGKI